MGWIPSCLNLIKEVFATTALQFAGVSLGPKVVVVVVVAGGRG